MLKVLFIVAVAFSVVSNAGVLNLSQVVVSDTNTWVVGPDLVGKAVLTWVHPAWSASIPGASWIWDSYLVSSPSTSQSASFLKSFYLAGVPVSGTLQIAADNYFSVTVNDQAVACGDATNGGTFQASLQQSCDVTNQLKTGVNELRVVVINAKAGNDPKANPAGLLFKISYNSNLVV